ncbi:MAG: TIGR02466 family protein, partial [Steroidobacteraceae bacterium]
MNSHVRALFPTLLYVAPLQRGGRSDLNRRLLAECLQLREDDLAGRRWSTRNYPGGYTSYGSLCRMQQLSPTFARLERALTTHVRSYAKSLALDLEGRELS